LLLTGCASAPPPDLSGSGSRVGELNIISATYGSGSHVTDVAAGVEKRLHMDCEFYVSPQWLGADPIPGWNKELILNYNYRGQRVLYHAGENAHITYKILLNHAKNQQLNRSNNPI
jgi:hypothetical protein